MELFLALKMYLCQTEFLEIKVFKNCVYSLPCSCGKIYKGETGGPLKVRLEAHRKAVLQGEIEKSGIADRI